MRLRSKNLLGKHKMPILSQDSILRKVPAALNPKQILFIDGIRHAVEIIDLAYERLMETLTYAALHPPSSSQLPKVSTTAFLDAWAIVDAIDRFKMLYQQMPGISFEPKEQGVETLQEAAQPFRDLRNIADHLAQRADFVVARNGSALGILTWMTGFKVEPTTIWHCSLRPGTVREKPELNKEPFTAAFNWPTDQITLSAGGYEGNISEFLLHIERRIKHFEKELEREFSLPALASHGAASDVFIRKAYSPVIS